jgi:hypothetical protein
MKPTAIPVFTLLALSGCSLAPPSAEKLAALPLITYPDKPPAGPFIYKLPAGQPIGVSLLIDGSALAKGVKQTANASLIRDIYLYDRWASEDRQRWIAAQDLIGMDLTVALPSYETPKTGEIHLTVNRKQSN